MNRTIVEPRKRTFDAEKDLPILFKKFPTLFQGKIIPSSFQGNYGPLLNFLSQNLIDVRVSKFTEFVHFDFPQARPKFNLVDTVFPPDIAIKIMKTVENEHLT